MAVLKYKKENYQTIVNTFTEVKSTSEKDKLPRIVFFLTLNGRSIRQIFRLIKTIYDDLHFYYFHIDEVNSKYLKTLQ